MHPSTQFLSFKYSIIAPFKHSSISSFSHSSTQAFKHFFIPRLRFVGGRSIISSMHIQIVDHHEAVMEGRENNLEVFAHRPGTSGKGIDQGMIHHPGHRSAQ